MRCPLITDQLPDFNYMRWCLVWQDGISVLFPPVFLAEIQYVPSLFRYIKMSCDESQEKGLYFRETGLAAYLTRWLPPETLANGAMSGAFFETYVISEILKSYSNRGLDYRYFVSYYPGKETWDRSCHLYVPCSRRIA